MKSKKLISFLCAAAMTASTFVGMVSTASAATDVFTYDDGDTSFWSNSGVIGADTTEPGKSKEEENGDAYFKADTGEGGGARSTVMGFGSAVTGISGDYVIEFDSYIYGVNGMGRESQTTQIAFTTSDSAADTRTFDDNYTGTGVGAGALLKIDTRKSYEGQGVVINDDASELKSDWTAESNYYANVQKKWTRTQAVVNTTAKTVTVTMIDGSGTKLVNGATFPVTNTTLTGIQLSTARGDYYDENNTRITKGGYILLDNVHIYPGAAEALTTTGMKGPVIEATLMPMPEVKVSAPNLIAPKDVTPVVNQQFGTAVDESMTDGSTEITAFSGLNIAMGGRADTDTYVKTADWAANDKVLTVAGGRFSTNGRGPKISAVDTLDVADGEARVMTFAVNLGTSSIGGAGRLYILGDTRQAGEDKQGAYNAVMGVLATDDYTYTEGDSDTSLVYQTEPYEWYKVAVIVSSDKYRIWIAKTDEAWDTTAQIYRDHVGQGESNIGMDGLTLPILAVTSGKDGSATGSVVRIDNMMTYKGVAGNEGPRNLLPSVGETIVPTAPPTPTPVKNATIAWDNTAKKATVSSTETEAYNAVLMHATYEEGTLVSLKSYDLEGVSATSAVETAIAETVHVGDKFMVWNSISGMIPYDVYTVKEGEGEAAKTPEPKPTPEVTDTPATQTPATQTPATQTPATQTPATQTPATQTPATPTPVPKYTVTVAPATNGTVEVSKTADVTAGEEITVTAKAAADYKLDAITVTDADGGAVAVTDGKFTMPAKNVTVTVTFAQLPELTGTVAVTGTAQVGQTLTAAVTGAPEGVTLKYQWMLADAANGTFAAITGATKSTRTINPTGEGKYIKVVVTADGYRGSVESTPQGPIAPGEATRYGITAAANPANSTTTITIKVGDNEVTEAHAGDTVTVAATAAEGYQITGVTTDDTDTEATKNEDGTYSFDMPEKAVAVTVNTVQIYAITKATPENGTLTVSAESAAANDTITITATPADGYQLKAGSLKVMNGENEVAVTAGEGNTYTFTMPAAAVAVSAEFEKIPHTVTITQSTNGTVSADKTTAEEGAEVTLTVTPADGYEVDTVTVKNGEADVEVTNNSFTMPAGNVTVTVTFKKVLTDGQLMAATYISRHNDAGIDVAEDANNNYSTTGNLFVGNPGNWARVGLIKFKATEDAANAAPIYRAYLKLTQKAIDTRLDNGFEVSSVNGDYDASTITFVDVYGEASIDDATKAAIQETSPIRGFNSIVQIGKDPNNNGDNLTSADDGLEYSIDVTDYVKSVKAAKGEIYSLALNKSRRGMTFYSLGSEHEPAIEIVRGINTTLTVQSAAAAETKVANAAVEIKDGDTVVATVTTGEDGTASVVLLPNKSYTYKVTSADYAIKNGTFTTTAADMAETVSLDANVPTTVEITSPDATIVTLDATVTFTATVKDQDGRAMADIPLTWSIVDAPANIAVADGVVSATAGVTDGNYTVQAAVTANTEVKATASFSVVTSAPATVTVKYQDENGTEIKADTTLSDNLFVGDAFTLPESEKASIKQAGTDGTTTIYEYDAENTTETIDALEATNTVIVKFTNTGAFYVYETYDGTGDGGFNIYSGSRGSATGATITDGELKISTNGNYGGVDGASRYKVIATPYTGKIAISFDAHNNGASGKGAMISLLDATVTAASGVASEVTTTANIADITLRNNNALTIGTATAMGSYNNSKHNFKFVIDFTNGTVDAYYDGEQVDMNGEAEGMTGTTTATQLSCIRVKHVNSATDTFFDNLIIEKLPTE